ncbi:hypothetical protein [Streptosporangium sp. LJ11]|uniref:hypothetical protein n=1 Tax=Streptosporangium sp. LJ11 TaxID=3436927 RepID=UPI003F79F721
MLIPLASDGGWVAVMLMTLAQFGAGFGLMLCDITGNSILQALTPERLLSRVQGAYLTFNAGVQARRCARRRRAGKLARPAAHKHRHRYLHAYPSVDHPASNAICRKLGFFLLGERDFEYPPGTTMRCNDWRLDL